MTLVEGIGDEVVQFVGVVLVITVAAIAWWSTNAQPGRYRTVLVMRSRAYHPVSVSIRTSSRQIAIANTQSESSPPPQLDSSDMSTETVDEGSEDNASVIPLQEMDSIVDADMAMMDNNRLHFYRRVGSSRTQASSSETSEEEAAEVASSSVQVQEMERIVSAMEAIDEFTTSGSNSNDSRVAAKSPQKKERNDNEVDASASGADVEENQSNSDNRSVDAALTQPDTVERRKIKIRLKYLNDTLREVEGCLDEQLKDFKWRHFSAELESACRVRLIYKGRVLLDEAATLRACGLRDNAVVHCLVHPTRPQAQQRSPGEEGVSGAEGAAGAAGQVAGAAPERAWDLDNILMTLVSVALTVVWFFRCEYSNMFTASASVALFGLTVFYSVAIFGLYLSDTFHFDRRPTQPAANN